MAIVHLGNILPGTASSSALDTKIPWSALEYSGDTQVITGISGSAIGGVGGGIDSATVSAIASSYVESGVSGKMDSSASSSFYPSDNPSGFITGVELSSYATTAYVDSSISSKLDASASSQFAPSGDYYSATNPSGFITGVDLSNYVPISAVSSWSSQIENLSAALSAIQTAMANVYTLSAGSGIQISSNTSTKVTVVQLS